MELGRPEGDEFSVILPGIPDANAVASVIDRLQGALHRPFKIEDQEYSIAASVGAALYPDDGDDAERLLGNAASAMHAAREDRRGDLPLLFRVDADERFRPALTRNRVSASDRA